MGRFFYKNVGANNHSPLPYVIYVYQILSFDNLLGSQDGVVVAELYEIHA